MRPAARGTRRDRVRGLRGRARALGPCGASSVALLEDAIETGHGGLQVVDVFVGGVPGRRGSSLRPRAFCRRRSRGCLPPGGRRRWRNPPPRPAPASGPGQPHRDHRRPRRLEPPARRAGRRAQARHLAVSRRKTGTAPDRLPAAPMMAFLCAGKTVVTAGRRGARQGSARNRWRCGRQDLASRQTRVVERSRQNLLSGIGVGSGRMTV